MVKSSMSKYGENRAECWKVHLNSPQSEHFNWNSDSEYFTWKSVYCKQMQWIQEIRSLDSFFLLYILQNDRWFF